MPNGYEGWGALGEVLAGGGGTAGAYEKQHQLVSNTKRAMEQASRARSLAIIDAGRVDNRGKLTPELMVRVQAGDPAAIAEASAYTLGSNSTVNLGQLGKYQQPHYGEASNIQYQALLGDEPDAALANRAGAYLGNKEYQPIRAEGGAYINDGATLGDLDMVPTLPTLNSMQRTEASIAQGERRTDAAVAKSNRAPAARGGGGRSGDGAISTSKSEGAELARARNAIQQGADPATVAKMLRSRGFPALAKKIYSGGAAE